MLLVTVSKYWFNPPTPLTPALDRHQTVVLSVVPLTIGATGAQLAEKLPANPIT